MADDEDADIAAAGEEDGTVTLVEVSPAQWDQVVEAKARGGLKELICSGRPGYIIAGLAEIGIEVSPADMTGWRVMSPTGAGEMVAQGANQVVAFSVPLNWLLSYRIPVGSSK